MSRVGRVALGLAVLVAAVAGCGSAGATILACSAFSEPGAVSGTLHLPTDDSGTAWLEASDGRRLSIRWPSGFAVRRSPGPALYGADGGRIGVEGDVIKLGTTMPSSAAGTPDDPYAPTVCDFVYP